MKMEKESIFGHKLRLNATTFTLFLLLLVLARSAIAWTGEIQGRVVCDVCGDSSIGLGDHVFQGAELAALCITKSEEVVKIRHSQIDTVAETISESKQWDACLVRSISSFHERCNRLGDGSSGFKFTYNSLQVPFGLFLYLITPKLFVYRFPNTPMHC